MSLKEIVWKMRKKITGVEDQGSHEGSLLGGGDEVQ